jgi:hypothetical protein
MENGNVAKGNPQFYRKRAIGPFRLRDDPVGTYRRIVSLFSLSFRRVFCALKRPVN